MAINAADLLVRVRADVGTARRELQKVNRDVNAMSAALKPATGFAKAFGIAAVAGFGVLGTQAVLGGVIQFTAALAPMLGLVAAAPALLFALVGTFAALKIGTLGFGKAMKDVFADTETFNESIKGLSPEAQKTARAIRGMQKPIQDLKRSVQDGMFRGMGQEVKLLGGAYLPLLRRELTATTVGINRGVRGLFQWLRTAPAVKQIGDLLGFTSKTANGLGAAIMPIVAGFVSLASGAIPALTNLDGSLLSIANRFRDWAGNAAATGKVTEWIREGATAAREFWGVLKNLGGAIQAIFSAGTGTAGGGFMANLEAMTGRLRAFLESWEGQNALGLFFESAARAGQALFPVIEAVLRVIAGLAPVLANIATGVGPGLTNLLLALLPAFDALRPSGTQLGLALGVFLESLIPLIPALVTIIQKIVDFATVIAPFGPQIMALVATFFALNAAATFVGAIAGFVGLATAVTTTLARVTYAIAQYVFAYAVLGAQAAMAAARVVASWVAMAAGQAASAAVMLAGLAYTVAQYVFAYAVLGAQAAMAAARVVASWAVMAAGQVASAAVMLAGLAATAVVWAATWIGMAAVAMANAVRMAATWFIAMGPVGWVIGIVIALVIVIIKNWDTIKEKTMQVFSAVWAFLLTTWVRIQQAIGNAVDAVKAKVSAVFAAIGAAITGYLNAYRAVVMAVWAAIQAIISGAVDRIKAAIARLGEIVGVIRSAFERARAAVVSVAGQMVSYVAGLPGRILGALGNLGGLLFNAGRSIIQGLINGIKNMAGAVKAAVSGVLQSARNLLPFSPAKEGPFSGKGWTLYSGRAISAALAEGISGNEGLIRQATRGMAEAASLDVSGVQVGPARNGAQTAAQERVRPGAMNREGAASSVSFQFITHNPVAEPQSKTTNKALSRAGALALV